MRSFVLAALLCTSAITPVHADPVSALVAGATAAAGTTAAAAGFAGISATFFSAGAFLTSGLGQLVVGLGLSFLTRGQGPDIPSPSDRMVNWTQPLTYQERGYGRARKGGPVGFTAARNGFRHSVVLIAAHPCKGPVEQYLDDQAVTTRGPATVLTEPDFVFNYDVPSLSGEFSGDYTTSSSLVLLTSQTDPVDNGPWVTGAGAWTRPAEYTALDTWAIIPVTSAAKIIGDTQTPYLEEGTYYTTDMDGVLVDTDATEWSVFAGLQPDAGDVLTAPFYGYSSLRSYTGGGSQAVDPILDAAFTEITSDYDFAGLSYVALRARRPADEDFPTVYAEGSIWVYNGLWDLNNQVYDPRTDSTGFTDNLGLCFAHDLTTYLGCQVDWTEVEAEADAADVTVTNGDGGTQKIWTCNGVLADDMDVDSVLQQFAVAGDMFISERTDGKVRFNLGRWVPPTLTLYLSDFVDMNLKDGAPIGSANEFVVTYPEPLNDHREAPAGTWVVDPSGNDTRTTASSVLIGNHNQAARVEKRMARKTHAQYRLSGTLMMIGYEVAYGNNGGPHRLVTLDLTAEIGKTLTIELDRITMNADGRTFSIEATSVLETDFDLDGATEEPDRPAYDQIEDDAGVVQDPSGLTGTAQSGTGASADILYEWTQQPRTLKQRLRYRRSGETAWRTVNVASGESGSPIGSVEDYATTPYSPPQTSYLATSLVDGATYEAQLQSVDEQYRYSDWKPDIPLTTVAIANPTPPASLSNFAAVGGAGYADLSWDTPNDAAYYATRIYRATGLGASFAGASLVATVYTAPNAAATYRDNDNGSGLSAGDYTWFGVPINSSGVAGTETAGADDAVT